uniref:Uncharacterized protein n=1 Tax=Heliothis virescens TaxID=7102 RepID=A0A2A4JLX3_HELVI
MAKILKKKRFTDASNIFIIVPTSNNSGSEAASDSLKSITSHASRDTHIVAERCTLVDTQLRKTPTSEEEIKVLGKGKKFYMQEIHTSDTSTDFQIEPVEVLRNVEERNIEWGIRLVSFFKDAFAVFNVLYGAMLSLLFLSWIFK